MQLRLLHELILGQLQQPGAHPLQERIIVLDDVVGVEGGQHACLPDALLLLLGGNSKAVWLVTRFAWQFSCTQEHRHPTATSINHWW